MTNNYYQIKCKISNYLNNVNNYIQHEQIVLFEAFDSALVAFPHSTNTAFSQRTANLRLRYNRRQHMIDYVRRYNLVILYYQYIIGVQLINIFLQPWSLVPPMEQISTRQRRALRERCRFNGFADLAEYVHESQADLSNILRVVHRIVDEPDYVDGDEDGIMQFVERYIN